MLRLYLEIGQSRFLPDPSQFSISNHPAVWSHVYIFFFIIMLKDSRFQINFYETAIDCDNLRLVVSESHKSVQFYPKEFPGSLTVSKLFVLLYFLE
jgi:hypothetical protein